MKPLAALVLALALGLATTLLLQQAGTFQNPPSEFQLPAKPVSVVPPTS